LAADTGVHEFARQNALSTRERRMRRVKLTLGLDIFVLRRL
jgi:hypothetical protein